MKVKEDSQRRKEVKQGKKEECLRGTESKKERKETKEGSQGSQGRKEAKE